MQSRETCSRYVHNLLYFQVFPVLDSSRRNFTRLCACSVLKSRGIDASVGVKMGVVVFRPPGTFGF